MSRSVSIIISSIQLTDVNPLNDDSVFYQSIYEDALHLDSLYDTYNILLISTDQNELNNLKAIDVAYSIIKNIGFDKDIKIYDTRNTQIWNDLIL